MTKLELILFCKMISCFNVICIIQINADDEGVSDSPCFHVFDEQQVEVIQLSGDEK